jgi:hypothetical protein
MNMTTPTTSKIAEKRSDLRSIISSMGAIIFFSLKKGMHYLTIYHISIYNNIKNSCVASKNLFF